MEGCKGPLPHCLIDVHSKREAFFDGDGALRWSEEEFRVHFDLLRGEFWCPVPRKGRVKQFVPCDLVLTHAGDQEGVAKGVFIALILDIHYLPRLDGSGCGVAALRVARAGPFPILPDRL